VLESIHDKAFQGNCVKDLVFLDREGVEGLEALNLREEDIGIEVVVAED